MLVNILSIENINKNDLKVYLQEISKIAIENNDIDFAWKTILYTKLI
jgi:hypothetical protein